MYPQQIIDALRHVRYPGTGKDLIESGMLEDDIRISGLEVSFSLIFEKDNDPFLKSVIKAAEVAVQTYVDANAAVHIHTKFRKQNIQPQAEKSPLKATKIIAIHSGKGGVGKSTVAANRLSRWRDKVNVSDCLTPIYTDRVCPRCSIPRTAAPYRWKKTDGHSSNLLSSMG